jgi:CheY-like chemotaxis protein
LRSIKKAGLPNPIVWCDNGDKALDDLYQRRDFAGVGKSPRPAVIFLDLNMPGTDGREVLRVVKQEEKLKSISIVVLTTSSDDRDIDAFFDSGANSYIVKPVAVAGIQKAVQQLESVWRFRF